MNWNNSKKPVPQLLPIAHNVRHGKISCGSGCHANWQPPYEIAVRLPVAHDITDDLDARETLDQEAQGFFKLNQRHRSSQAQVTARAEIEDRSRPLALDAEFVRLFKYRRIVIAGNDRGEQPGALGHRNAGEFTVVARNSRVGPIVRAHARTFLHGIGHHCGIFAQNIPLLWVARKRHDRMREACIGIVRAGGQHREQDLNDLVGGCLATLFRFDQL